MGAVGPFLASLTAGEILVGAGAAVTAGAAILEGVQAGRVADYNAALAEIDADYRRKKGDIEQQLHEEDLRRFLGRQRAIAGASGGAVDQGTTASILMDTRRRAEIDAAIMRFETEAGIFQSEAQAELFEQQGDYGRAAGFITAGSTILNTAGKFVQDRKSPLTKKKPKFDIGYQLPPT